jgi:Tfp pilus assembly protein PilN
MLRTNLSTRPFYNERLAALLVGLLGALVLIFTLFNIVQLATLSGRDVTLRKQAADDVDRAADLRRRAQQARLSVNREQLAKTAAAAHEANGLIDRRAFSWTELFNRFEDTLPSGVRITGVQPRRDSEQRFIVTIDVVAREVDQVDAFMEALEQRGGFRDVLARSEQVDEEGLVATEVSGVYLPIATPVPAAEAQP